MEEETYSKYYNTIAENKREPELLVQNIINELKARNIKLDIFLTGGGVPFLSLLMGRVGASAYINQVHIPYSNLEVDVCTSRFEIKKYCSASVAFRLASEGFSTLKDSTFKIAVTASLQNNEDPNKQRKGRKNHAYVCFIYKNKLLLKHVTFNPDLRREVQEHQLAVYLHSLLYQALIADWEHNVWDMLIKEDDNIIEFITKQFQYADYPIVLYSGSFRPMHKGHEYIMSFNEGFNEDFNNALLEIPFTAFGKESERDVDPSVDQYYGWFRLNKTRIIDKLEFIDILADNRNYNIRCGLQTRHIYRMGSDTLNRIADDEFETLNSFTNWRFQIFDREPTTEDLLDTIENKLVKLKQYEYISMPEELRGLSSTQIREQLEESKENNENINTSDE